MREKTNPSKKNTIKPGTVLIKKAVCIKNTQAILEKTQTSNNRYRPQFKVPFPKEISHWLHDLNITGISVPSVSLAEYVISHDWTDVLIETPIQIDELPKLKALSSSLSKPIHIELVIRSAEDLELLEKTVTDPASIWIGIDTGSSSPGIDWGDIHKMASLINRVKKHEKLQVKGLITDENTIKEAKSAKDIRFIYEHSISKLQNAQERLLSRGLCPLELSYGDTASCANEGFFIGIDEIRSEEPLYYDLRQAHASICNDSEIAIAITCPIISVNNESAEITIELSSSQLSTNPIIENDITCYGKVALFQDSSWGPCINDSYLKEIDDRKGIIKTKTDTITQFRVGEQVAIVPVNATETVNRIKKTEDIVII